MDESQTGMRREETSGMVWRNEPRRERSAPCAWAEGSGCAIPHAYVNFRSGVLNVLSV